jgi:hypothetical protein
VPYINQRQRAILDLGADAPHNAGELNYAISRTIHAYLRYKGGDLPRYSDFNEVIGVLECAKLELYRRHVAPYEDVKIAENGDVP